MKTILISILALTLAVACNAPQPPASDAAAAADAVAAADAATPPSPASRADLAFSRKPRPASTFVPASHDTRSQAQIDAAACQGVPDAAHPDGWRCSGKKPVRFMAASTTPIIPVSWTVPNWYFDPANSITCASDSNSGTAATCTGGCSGSVCTGGVGPVRTWGEIQVHRLGQTNPQLQQATTFHMLSGQTIDTDYIFFEPQLPNGAQAVLLGTLTSVGTIAANVATVTAQVRGGPGTRWAVSNMPVGAAAKNLLQDTTLNTWSTIDSIAGGTATISQPLPNSLITTVGIPTLSEGSMATNDTFTVWAQPLANLKVWRPKGDDVSSGGVSSTGWSQFIEIADSSTSAASQYNLVGDSTTNVLSACRVDTRLNVTQFGGRSGSAYVLGGDVTGVLFLISGSPTLYGGIMRGGTLSDSGSGTVDGDIVFHTAIDVNAAFLNGGDVFIDSTLLVQGGGIYRSETSLWGSGNITVNPGSTYWDNNGSSFANTVTNGTLRLGSAVTGSSYSAGTWTSGVALNLGNLAADHGLSQPISGARFTDGTN
jgi:hypothetical protein